jgi:hypothetical protein
MREPKPGEKYVHFKGGDKIYEIIAVARSCDNFEEKFVIYKSLYDDKTFSKGTVFSRSLEDFCSLKELGDKKVRRFTKLK